MDAFAFDAPCGLIAFADDGVMLDANGSASELVGQERQALIGQRFDSLLDVPGRIFFQTHLFPLLKMSGRIEEAHLSMRNAAGEDLPILLNAERRNVDDTFVNVGAIVTMRRRIQYEAEIIATRRNMEAANAEKELANAELTVLKERLQFRVEERTADLVAANAEMEGFTYSIAHDLRTPLRAISSTSSILLEEASEGLSEDHRFLLERQALNSERLGQLIDDLLKFSRLARTEFERLPIDMTAMAEEVLAEMEEADGIAACEYEVDGGMVAEGSPRLVRIVLANLLHNACKFSPEGGKVSIRSSARFETNETVFEVRDEGVGFDMRFADKLFKPFQRLVADHEFPGTGIGLANVQRIVRRHGGTIWAEGEVGKGAAFFFTLTPPIQRN